MRLSLFAAALCLSSLAAHADTFQYSGSVFNSEFPDSNFSFQTTGIAPVTSATTLQPSEFTYVGGNQPTSLILDNQNQGGFLVQFSQGQEEPVPDLPVADYSMLGTYSATAYNTNGVGNNQTLTLTVSDYVAPPATVVTPEPSSFALLGTGLFGAIGVARRRFA